MCSLRLPVASRNKRWHPLAFSLGLLLGMRDAERGRGDQVFAFVAVDGVEGERVLASLKNESRPEIVDSSGFGREVGHGERPGAIVEPRLPVHAEMVFAGTGREEDIRTALAGSNPGAVQSYLRECTIRALKLPYVLDHVDQCLVSIRLGRGCWVVSCRASNLTFLGPHAAWAAAMADWSWAKAEAAKRIRTRADFITFLRPELRP